MGQGGENPRQAVLCTSAPHTLLSQLQGIFVVTQCTPPITQAFTSECATSKKSRTAHQLVTWHQLQGGIKISQSPFKNLAIDECLRTHLIKACTVGLTQQQLVQCIYSPTKVTL